MNDVSEKREEYYEDTSVQRIFVTEGLEALPSLFRLEMISRKGVVEDLGTFDSIEESVQELGQHILDPETRYSVNCTGPVYLKRKGIPDVTYVDFGDPHHLARITEMGGI